MIKKISFCLAACGAATIIASCTHTPEPGVARAEVWQPQIKMPGSVVVCRSKQCAPAKLSMSKEYIYNSLLHLLDNNSQNKALLCTADAASHVCTENYISLPITVGVTPANMYIDDVKITDVSASLGNKSLNLVLNYNVTYNGQSPTCKPAQSLIYVKNANNIILEDAGYSCKMTTIGNTTIKTLFAIDYIDLDYGYIGGYYSIGLSGPAYGGNSGYMMMRLPNDAYPLAPALTAPEETQPITAAIEPTAPQLVENQAQTVLPEAPTAVSTELTITQEVTAEIEHPKQKVIKKKIKVKKKAKPTVEKKKKEEYTGVQIFPISPKKPAAVSVSKTEADTSENQEKSEHSSK